MFCPLNRPFPHRQCIFWAELQGESSPALKCILLSWHRTSVCHDQTPRDLGLPGQKAILWIHATYLRKHEHDNGEKV